MCYYIQTDTHTNTYSESAVQWGSFWAEDTVAKGDATLSVRFIVQPVSGLLSNALVAGSNLELALGEKR